MQKLVSSMLVLALVALAVLVQPGMCAPAKTIKVNWVEVKEPFKPIIACKNNKDQVVFSWSDDPHNLVPSTSTTGKYDMCAPAKRGKPIVPLKATATWTLDTTKVALGNYGYICTLGAHCTAGNMRIVVTVKNC
jgi:plastocyanin